MKLSITLISILGFVLFNSVLAFSLDEANMSNEKQAFFSGVSFGGLEDFKVGEFSLLSLHKSLVDTPSVSEHELIVANLLYNYLERAGLTVELQKVKSAGERYNVYAYVGKTRDTKVLITSHIDTVPPFFPYRIEGTKIYGRGSCDAKGSVATQVLAFLSLLKAGELKEGDASLLFVVGEELDGSGMKHVGNSLNASWESGIFGEPTELKLTKGHKGLFSLDLHVDGKASHSGYPELGLSSTEILVPVLAKLLNLDLPGSDILGPSTLNIGRIDAGVAGNVLPTKAFARITIRVAEDLSKVDKLVHEVIDDVEHLTSSQMQVEPQYLDYKVPGFDTIIVAYATDIPNLSIKLKTRYLYGPGSIHVAHGDNEHVENSDLIDAVAGYKKLIKYVLQN